MMHGISLVVPLQIMGMPTFKLRSECKKMGVDDSGSSAEMRERLIAFNTGASAGGAGSEPKAAAAASPAPTKATASPAGTSNTSTSKYVKMAAFKIKGEARKLGINADGSADDVRARLIEADDSGTLPEAAAPKVPPKQDFGASTSQYITMTSFKLRGAAKSLRLSDEGTTEELRARLVQQRNTSPPYRRLHAHVHHTRTHASFFFLFQNDSSN